jgi:hypothetical protein
MDLIFNLACVAVFVIAGVGGFWFRLRFQFWYGAIEFVIAMIVEFLVLQPQNVDSRLLAAQQSTLFGIALSRAAGVAAGIYIMVRGLDNMSKKPPTSGRRFWDWLFLKR